MIELRKYSLADYDAIQDAVEPFCVDDEMIEATGHGIAITASDGDVMACGGICMVGDEGVAWMRIGRGCKDNAFIWARTIVEAFKLMLESVEIPVSAYILKGFCSGDRLARAVGMKNTGEQEEHNGNTYYKYKVA